MILGNSELPDDGLEGRPAAGSFVYVNAGRDSHLRGDERRLRRLLGQ